MAQKQSPLKTVQEKFGEKSKLIKAVEALGKNELWLKRLSKDKGLECVSNAKLLRLHRLLSEAKSEFGSRGALIDALLKLNRREKDQGFRARLERYPTPRLLDLHRAAGRRSARVQPS